MFLPEKSASSENPSVDIFSLRSRRGEPVIPLNIVEAELAAGRYTDIQWDYVFLSHSPGYVPRKADARLSVIGAYIGDL